ncbi:hypothetical protein ABW20_dc0104805 [Dactylellina cionopaga]|nr:hypothetical protein ABW20_dc0104805 [Dactylellina cionopaga]
MANRSHRPPPIDIQAALTPLKRSMPKIHAPEPISHSRKVSPSLSLMTNGSCDELMLQLRQDGPSGSYQNRGSPRTSKNRDSPRAKNPGATGYKCVDEIGGRKDPNRPPSPRIPRHCDDLIEQLRSGGGPSSRRTRGKTSAANFQRAEYRGVQYNGPDSPIVNGVPEWYYLAQAQLKTKNPYKYYSDGEPGNQISTPPPSGSIPLYPTGDDNYVQEVSVPTNINGPLSEPDEKVIEIDHDKRNLPMSPISPIDQVGTVVPAEAPVSAEYPSKYYFDVGDMTDHEALTIQQDIEDNLNTIELYRTLSNQTHTSGGSSYVNRLRHSAIMDKTVKLSVETAVSVSVYKNDEISEDGIPQDEVNRQQSVEDTDTGAWDFCLDYYSHVIHPYDDVEEEKRIVRPLPVVIEEEQESVDALPALVGEKCEPVQPVPVAIETIQDPEFGRKAVGIESLNSTDSRLFIEIGADEIDPIDKNPRIIISNRTIIEKSSVKKDPVLTESSSIQKQPVVLEKLPTEDAPAPPPIPPKRRVPQPFDVVGSESLPHEIKDVRIQPQVVQTEVASLVPPVVTPEVPFSPESEAPSPPPKSRPQTRSSTETPSIAELARNLAIPDDNVFDFVNPRRLVTDKAMRVLGLEPQDLGTPLPHVSPPPDSKLAKDLHHLMVRKDFFESELPKTPTKAVLITKTLRKVTGTIFGRKRSKFGKTDSLPNTPKSPKAHERNSSLDPTSDSTRTSFFKKLFTNGSQQDRPSTSGSNRSFGVSLHESWGSGHASGGTGVTSTDDAFIPDTVNFTLETGIVDPTMAGDYGEIYTNIEPTVQIDEPKLGARKSKFFDFGKDAKVPEDTEKVTTKEKRGGGLRGIFKRETEEEAMFKRADEAIDYMNGVLRENAIAEREREERITHARLFEKQEKAKMLGRPGFVTESGEYFRAKNPLELTLCDTDDEGLFYNDGSDELNRAAEMDAAFAGAESIEIPPMQQKGRHNVPSPIAEEAEFFANGGRKPIDPDQYPILREPYIPPEPTSHWSDDSDADDNSQPTTPSHPSFGRSFKSHKRNGSGGSNLGTGPMLMRKAVRKLKGNRKSSAPPPVEAHVVPSPPSKGNRDSMMSTVSTATRESNRRISYTSLVPPIPVPRVPARDGVTVAPTALTIPQITTGTYHDQSGNVIHRFGGTLPERSGSSLGHRGDRTSTGTGIPERCRSSLGHSLSDSASGGLELDIAGMTREQILDVLQGEEYMKMREKEDEQFKTRFDKEEEKTEKQLRKQSEEDKKKSQKDDEKAKKSAAKVDKLRRKAEKAAKKEAELLKKAELVKKDLGIFKVNGGQEALKVHNLAYDRFIKITKLHKAVQQKYERQAKIYEFKETAEQEGYDPMADLDEEERQQEMEKVQVMTEKRRLKLHKLLGDGALPEILGTENKAQHGMLTRAHRDRQFDNEEAAILWEKATKERERQERIDQNKKKEALRLARRQKRDAIRVAIHEVTKFWVNDDNVDTDWDPEEIKAQAKIMFAEDEEKRKALEKEETQRRVDGDMELLNEDDAVALGVGRAQEEAKLKQEDDTKLFRQAREKLEMEQQRIQEEALKYDNLAQFEIAAYEHELADTDVTDAMGERIDEAITQIEGQAPASGVPEYDAEEYAVEENENLYDISKEYEEIDVESDGNNRGEYTFDIEALEKQAQECRTFYYYQDQLKTLQKMLMDEAPTEVARIKAQVHYDTILEKREQAYRNRRAQWQRRKLGRWASLPSEKLDELDKERWENCYDPTFNPDDYPPLRDPYDEPDAFYPLNNSVTKATISQSAAQTAIDGLQRIQDLASETRAEIQRRPGLYAEMSEKQRSKQRAVPEGSKRTW